MIQIFIVGSSTIYGVGGENGGWADIVKQKLHKKMYGKDGVGEKFEIYNFGKSLATIDFVRDTFPILVEHYGRGGKIITIFNVGGNNIKAVDTPENFVSTLEEYSAEMEQLLDMLEEKSTDVIAVGSGHYDESKTNPKLNPFTGGQSYFSNDRKIEFENEFERLCEKKDIAFINVGIEQKKWVDKYNYQDGVHANTAGHELIGQKVLTALEPLLSE